MKSKKALLGLLVAAAVAIPVVASPKNNLTPVMNAAYFSFGAAPPNPVAPTGMFANFTTKSKIPVLTFGSTAYNEDAFIGMRVDAPSSQAASSFQMDINSEAGDDPFFKIYTVAPGSTAGAFFNNPYIDDSGITVTPLKNGFYRYYYSASSNGVPTGSKWSEIYLVDSTFTQDSFEDIVTNVMVNGHAATANVTPPQYDCNLDY